MPSKTSAADILARFPGPVTLYPSLKQWGLIFAGCAVFALIGQWMARSGQQVMGWAVLMFFGAGTVIAAFAMLPRAAALTLDASGFEIMNFYRRRRTRWQDAGDFTAARIPPAVRVLSCSIPAKSARRWPSSTRLLGVAMQRFPIPMGAHPTILRNS